MSGRPARRLPLLPLQRLEAQPSGLHGPAEQQCGAEADEAQDELTAAEHRRLRDDDADQRRIEQCRREQNLVQRPVGPDGVHNDREDSRQGAAVVPGGEERGHGRERAQENRQRSTSPRDVRQRPGEDQSDREGTERERFGRQPAG